MAFIFGKNTADNLNGTNGDDYLLGSAGNDKLSGLAGKDNIIGDSGNDSLNGGDDEDLLYGADGNDTLDGGPDNDTLIGGLGDDIYIVDSASNIIIENTLADGGKDTVQSSVTFTLGNGLENLTLEGINQINGTGNTLNNVITGNDDVNTLSGLAGNDTLNGGEGNDTLTGAAGSDRLAGGSGNDSLTGGTQVDQSVYNTNSAFDTADVGLDTIRGFISGTDKIVLDLTTFNVLNSDPGNGFNVTTEFATVANDLDAAINPALITYSTGSRTLFYNENGADTGFGTGASFATLPDTAAMVATDFIIEA